MKFLKKMIAPLLALSMLLSLSGPALALDAQPETAAIAATIENIGLIEQGLSAQGMDVITGLSNYKARLETVLQNSDSSEDALKIQRLIHEVDRLSAAYCAYKDGARSAIGIYDAAIGAVITYFEMRGDVLAAELLTHAANNSTLDSYYTPYRENLYKIQASSVWAAVRNKPGSSGSGTFDKSYSEDLYYAIHHFDWYRTSTHLQFEDRYDFAPGDYDGLAGTAVNTMYYAQQAGELVPFYTTFYEQV